jgi:DNA-directed RNA polymerase subunit K/omega
MSDDDYDEIDIAGELDEFDEIEVEDANEINFEDVRDRDDADNDEDDADDDSVHSAVDAEEDEADAAQGEDDDVIVADYFHKVLDKQPEDYISSVSVEPKDAIVVDPDKRLTRRFVTKKEYARILGVRTKLISLYAKVFTDVTNIIDPKLMAIKEIKEKKCPLMLKREVGTTKDGKKLVELWSVNELIIPFD